MPNERRNNLFPHLLQIAVAAAVVMRMRRMRRKRRRMKMMKPSSSAEHVDTSR